MPVMDGMEAPRRIKQRPVTPKIVFLTAHALQEYRDKTAEIGADGFLSKPFKFDSIKKVLGGLFPPQTLE